MYRIYYTHDGEITTVGVSEQLGDYIECDLETMLEIQKAVHLYQIQNKKIIKKQTEINKPPRLLFLDKDGPGWICSKDNLFNVLEYAKVKPKWFNSNQHSWVKYD